ncbi:MerR family transcriptional regulator [Ruminiclostridium cellobioparum]|uniref:MerR family transcriptional regulator n=1 Tax=Ruminiclostridium cellobioparum TaxID=29355 RepID=UPI000481BA85|nr:MerR family transcriptional regulator [Ruminiclostridium cellobioparum]
MEYTVQKLAALAGVSTRTLRYYDEIGILKPARINSSGYRIYGRAEVDRLQQILFYRELEVSLENIKEILSTPGFNSTEALRDQHSKLLAKREQINLLLANIEKTLAAAEGSIKMTDKEKFEGFKQKLINENEEKYGREIREKYGDKAVDDSNSRMMGLTREEYERFEKLGQELNETLRAAMETSVPAGELGQKAAELHRQWLSFTWGSYSREAHAGVARMYVEDERFKSYYDRIGPGAAEFLRDAVLVYTGMDK